MSSTTVNLRRVLAAGLVAVSMPASLTLVGTAWGLVELVVAAEVAAYLYRDESSTASVHRSDGPVQREK